MTIVHAQLSEFYSVVAYAVEHIGAVLKPFAFETIYGHYVDRVTANDAKTVPETSVARYVASIEGKRGYELAGTTFDRIRPILSEPSVE